VKAALTPTNDPDDNTPDDKAPTREELKAELKALGVEYPSRATIAQLTELLEAARNNAEGVVLAAL
jgi:sugar phosphate isomerase/epimerase